LEETVSETRYPILVPPLVLLPPLASALEHLRHRRRVSVDRHEVVRTPEQVQLVENELGGRVLRRVDDDEVVAAMSVAMRTLMKLQYLLEREPVKPEFAAKQRHLGHRRIGDVEPDPVGVVGEQLAEAIDAH